MCKTLRTIATAICALFLLPLSAQEKADTVYTFRFVPEDDMFYVPWNGNGNELSRLAACVERYREEILDGRMPLRVDGYCNSFDSEAENLATAKIRSNRVKSELIVRQKLTEECFITRNHSGSGDYVTVRLVIPAEKDEAEEARLAAERAEQERIAAEQAERQRLAAEKAEAERAAQQQTATQQNAIVADTPSETETPTDYHLSLSSVPACQPAALGYPDTRFRA